MDLLSLLHVIMQHLENKQYSANASWCPYMIETLGPVTVCSSYVEFLYLTLSLLLFYIMHCTLGQHDNDEAGL